VPTAIGTAYGEPWDSMEGGGTTSTGVKLGGGKQVYVVAVNPNIIPYGSKLKIPHNPFGNPNIIFTAADTGGAFHSSNKIDFYIADTKGEGNHNRLFHWGSQKITYQIVGHGSPHDVMQAGQEGGAHMPGVPGTPGTPPQVTGKVIPESTNTTQAIIDSLLKSTMTQSQKLPHLGSAGSNPLTLAQNAVASGQYTTPAHTELGVTPGTPGQPAQPGGGLAGQAAGGGWRSRCAATTPRAAQTEASTLRPSPGRLSQRLDQGRLSAALEASRASTSSSTIPSAAITSPSSAMSPRAMSWFTTGSVSPLARQSRGRATHRLWLRICPAISSTAWHRPQAASRRRTTTRTTRVRATRCTAS